MTETKEDRTIRAGSRVVFRDKYKTAHVGTVERFEHNDRGKIVGAHIVGVESESLAVSRYLVGISQVAQYGTVAAERWLHPAAHLNPGQVVLVTFAERVRAKTFGGVAHGDLGVVLQDKGDMVNVAKLCGTDKDQYARLPHSALTVVDVSGAIMELAKMARDGDL
jgi:hypothetical protein